MRVSDKGSFRPYETADRTPIFALPLEVFPDFWAYAYLVLVDDFRVLIDAGSGFGDSNRHLEAGFRQVSAHIGREITLQDLTHVFITHGHIDHFGGLTYVSANTRAQVGVHELDRRNLTNYEERLAVVSNRLEEFLVEAGVAEDRLPRLLEMYNLPKALFSSVNVDFTYEAMNMRVGPFEFLHVPGHCAGAVVIRLHDVLFSGDHILSGISPHQAPERLTLNTGLGHYLQSLQAALDWAGDVRLTLGGHRDPIEDLDTRVAEIRALHVERLEQVWHYLRQPHTIAEISHHLFGEVHGYNVLLALEEAGAHVEYLYQRGRLGIANLAELENGHGPVTLYYRSLPA